MSEDGQESNGNVSTGFLTLILLILWFQTAFENIRVHVLGKQAF